MRRDADESPVQVQSDLPGSGVARQATRPHCGKERPTVKLLPYSSSGPNSALVTFFCLLTQDSKPHVTEKKNSRQSHHLPRHSHSPLRRTNTIANQSIDSRHPLPTEQDQYRPSMSRGGRGGGRGGRGGRGGSGVGRPNVPWDTGEEPDSKPSELFPVRPSPDLSSPIVPAHD